MSVIGTLAVKITGDNSNLDKSLKKSTADISAFAKKSALAMTAVAGVFTVFAKRTIDNMDAMSKMAQQAGVSVEALSSLGYAADLSGLNVQAMTRSLAVLSKGMADASAGTGEAKKAFDALGMDSGSIATADQALLKIADRFAKMPDGIEKTSIASRLFGERMGRVLIPMLNQGSEGIKKMQRESDLLGKTLSTTGAQSAERFNDNLTRLAAIGQGLTNQLMTGLLPVLEDITAQMFNAYVEVDQTDQAATQLSQNKLPEWVQGLGITFGVLADTVLMVLKTIGNADNIFAGFSNRFETMGARLERFIATAKKPIFGEMSKELQDELDAIDAKIFNLNMKGLDLYDVVNKNTADAFAFKYTKTIQDAFDKASVNIDPLGSRKPTLPSRLPSITSKESKELADKMKKEADEYSAFIGEITGKTDRERQAQEESWLALARSVGDITVKEYEDAIAKLRDVEDQMSQFAVSAARNIQGVLGDGIYNVLSGKFDDISQSFLNMINRMTADLLSSQISQLLFGNFGNTNQIGGVVGQIASAVGSALGGGLGGMSSAGTAVPSSYGSVGASGSFGGLSSGGYTGDGGKYEPAGIVHRGEYVLNAAATKRIGVNNLERMNKGYANGGYVGSAPTGGVNINIKNEAGADGYKATAQARQNSDGGLNIDVLVRRVVSSDISNNGALAQQMANTFGLRRAI